MVPFRNIQTDTQTPHHYIYIIMVSGQVGGGAKLRWEETGLIAPTQQWHNLFVPTQLQYILFAPTYRVSLNKGTFSIFIFFCSRSQILLFCMCFGVRILSPVHLATQIISIQNPNCPKNEKLHGQKADLIRKILRW